MLKPFAKIGLILCVPVFFSCQEASLTGGTGKKQNSADAGKNGPGSNVDQQGIRTPDIDDFDDTGWVPNDIREEYEEMFSGKPSEDTGGDDSNGSDTDTSTSGDKPDVPFADDEQVFWLGCPGPDDRPIKLAGPKGMKIRFSGEFCPSRPAKDKLSVLFVVDFSGSMFGNPFEGPNDPTENNSCGRLKAAEALVKSYVSSDFKGVDVDVGMVGFSNTASLRIPFTSAKSMKGNLSPTTWCGSDSPVAKTNYQAAFQEARNALASVKGEKVVFFISDGSPTAGNGNPESAGLQAAQDLRNADKDLALNVIFLGYKNGDAKNPQGYLESVAGSKDNVTLVASADQLVEAVQAIGLGKIKMKSSDVEAIHKVNGKENSLKIADFRKNPKRANRWIFVSEPFTLVGEKGKTVDNQLEVKGKTSDDKEILSSATIQYEER